MDYSIKHRYCALRFPCLLFKSLLLFVGMFLSVSETMIPLLFLKDAHITYENVLALQVIIFGSVFSSLKP